MELREKQLQEDRQNQEEGERHMQEEEEQGHYTGQENLGVLAGVSYPSSEISNLPPVPSYEAVIEGGDNYPIVNPPSSVNTAVSSLSDPMDTVTAGVGGMSLYSGYTPLSSFPAPPSYESFPPATSAQTQPLVDRSTKPAEGVYLSLQQPEIDRSSKPVAPVTGLSSMSDVGDFGTTVEQKQTCCLSTL